jgi:hypothetical protein
VSSVWGLIVALADARAQGDRDRVRVLERQAREQVACVLAHRAVRGRFPRARRERAGFVSTSALEAVRPVVSGPAQFSRGRF